jgi:hypothetical protein
MTDAELPDVNEQAENVVVQMFADRGDMVVRFVLVADVIDATGQRAQVVATAPEAQVVDVLGLLHFGVEVQREAFRESG